MSNGAFGLCVCIFLVINGILLCVFVDHPKIRKSFCNWIKENYEFWIMLAVVFNVLYFMFIIGEL